MQLERRLIEAALPAYEIGGELGRGAWGVVLSGRHRQLDRPVAIKQLPRAFGADPAVRSRFVAEARVLASFDHPHIVPVYDFVEHEGVLVLVMEHLTGGSVWDRFTTTGLAMADACAVTLATCAALHHAHERKVLHRDIKPENLLFSASGVVKVTDFGIAKVVGGEETMATRAGDVLGTPAYMAPEQAAGRPLSPATDVYAVGTLLYELLAGRLPFEDDGDALGLLYRHVHEPPRPLLDVADVPRPLAEVVMTALATDPLRRPVTAEDLGVAVAEAASASWGPGWLGGAGVGVMAAGAILRATERPASTVTPSVEPTARPTIAPREPPPTAPPAATPALPPPVGGTRLPTSVVRPTVAVRAAAVADQVDVDPADLVPVKTIARPAPRRPVRRATGPRALAGVFAAVTLIVALLGVGDPSLRRDLPAGAVRLAQPERDTVDLGDPLTVVLDGGAVATRVPGPGRIELSFLVAGVSVLSTDGEFDGTRGVVDPGAADLVIPSPAHVRVRLTNEAGDEAVQELLVDTAQGPLTAVGGVGLLAVLYALASIESARRRLRRRPMRTGPVVTMAWTGGLCGLGLVALSWALLAQPVTQAAWMLAVVTGAAAGLAFGLSYRR